MTAFSALIGQKQAVELLTSAVTRQRIAPAYLFNGPEGVGRHLAAIEFTTLILAEEQNVNLVRHKVQSQNHPDLLTVEPTYLQQGKLLTEAQAQAEGLKRKAPPQIRVEQIREIARFLSRPPLEASRAVVIIEAAHTMAEAAANALLKTLEEPGKATIILIAPSADSLLPTLVSRCQRIPFYRLSMPDLKQVLAQTDQSEIIEQETLCAIAQGSPGEAMIAKEHLTEIPNFILQQLETLINHQEQSSLINTEIALNLGKEISQNLDFPTQIWLINYLQQRFWKQGLKTQVPLKRLSGLEQLETSRKMLLSYVQPRLVWEVTLLQIGEVTSPKSLDHN
ncbi:UNVERIFIED_CONTAM: DNA polymerase III subunit delta' [Euhalothece sp. KZN 001]